MSELLSVVLGAKKAGLVHIWLSTAEGKWSERSEKLKVLKKKKQVEGLNQSKKKEAKPEESLICGGRR